MIEDIRAVLPKLAERDARDSETYPSANLADLRAAGLPIGPFPAELGGSGLSLLESVQTTELVASVSGSTALVLSMPLGLAVIFATSADAVPEQYRPRWQAQREWAAEAYRAGKLFAACNSERGAGGSLDATKTTAAAKGSGFALTGEKILASGGSNAAYFFSTAKVDPEQLPGCGVVEFFFVPTAAPGVEILDDWDGFGMRSTESHTVRYNDAVAEDYLGFPDFINIVQPLQAWFCLFAAIPLGAVGGMLAALSSPAPTSPALRLRLAEATMRLEALQAYLYETAREWQPGAPPAYRARVLRAKTHVTQESARLAADLFALSGGRSYRRGNPVARAFADTFAGTALRPPLALGLETLTEQFGA